jgi:hypothetical protein
MKTLIYYTSNRENPEFEHRIQENLKEQIGDMPVISVSQKPIDFGENICVGDIGASAKNVLAQMKTGAEHAATKYIVFAESDCLYHKSYFDIEPEEDDAFYYPNRVYLLWAGRHKFYRKNRRELTSIVNRKHFINVANQIFADIPVHISEVVPTLTKQNVFNVRVPVVDIKTRNGLHWSSPYLKRGHRYKVAFWGTAQDIFDKYL